MLTILVFATLLLATSSLDNGLGLSPPMGWSSWNYYLTDVSDSVIREMATAIVSLGLHDLGYEYVNIDAGYLLDSRDVNGNLVVDPSKFPYGMSNLSDYIHGLGLKMGVYTDLGQGSCGSGPGSYGHYQQDADTFASWGVDYLKVDFCGSVPTNESEWYYWAQFRDALNATGRPIYYSICPKSIAPDNGTAIPYAGQLVYSPPSSWNVTDHRTLSNSWLVEYVNNVDNWYSTTSNDCIDAGGPPCGMITNIDAFNQMTQWWYSSPGGWNDCDMLQVCNDGHLNGGMNLTEYQASLSIWAIFGAPLILSAPLPDVQPDCLDLIQNAEVIAIDQDPLGSTGRLVRSLGGTTTPTITQQVYVRNLTSNAFAAVLFNRAASSANITLLWSDLGVDDQTPLSVRDTWRQETLGTFTGSFVATVDVHQALLLRIY